NHSWRSRYSPPRSSRMAWRQGPQGSKQHLDLAAAVTRARTQRPRKYLAIHAAELAIEPNFQILRRYRRSLLPPGTRSTSGRGKSCPSRTAIGQPQVTQSEDWYKTLD